MHRSRMRMEKLSKRANKQTTKQTANQPSNASVCSLINDRSVKQMIKRARDKIRNDKQAIKTKTNETMSRLEKEEADKRMINLLS